MRKIFGNESGHQGSGVEPKGRKVLNLEATPYFAARWRTSCPFGKP